MSDAARTRNELRNELEVLRARVKELEDAEVKRERTEKALRESEARYRALVEHVPAITYTAALDETSTTLYISPQVQSLLGYSQAEYKADPDIWRKSLHPDDRERVLSEVKRAHNTGSPFACEYRMLARDGREVWFRDEGVAVRDERDQLLVLQGVMLDITSRKQAEEARHESEERFRTLFDGMSSGVAVYEAVDDGRDFVIVDFNRAGERIESVAREDIVGRRITDVFPSVEEFGLLDVFRRVWQTGEPEHHPITLYKDERIAGWRENFVYRLPSGEVVALYDDITERKRAEEALRESEARLREMADTIEDVFWVTDWAEKRTVFASSAYEKVWGRSLQGLYNDPGDWTSAIHPDDRERAWQNFLHLEQGRIYDEEYRITRPDGSTHWIRDRGFPIRDENGLVHRVVGIAQDITERKRAEEGLRRTECIVSSSTDMLALLDKNYVYLAANEAYLKAFGKTREELIGYTAAEVFGQKFFDTTIRPNAVRCLAGEEIRYEDWFDFPVSGRQYMDIAYFPYADVDDQIKGFVVCGRNATGRKLAEEKLRESEERYRILAEKNPHGIEVIDPTGIITYVNPAYQKMLGYTKEELLGTCTVDLIEPPSKRPKLREYLSLLVKEEPEPTVYFQQNRRKDGEVIEQAVSWEYSRDGEGNVVGFISVITDITERKRAEQELRRSEENFRQIAETVREAFWVGSPDWSELHYVSPAYEEIWGRSCQSLYDDPRSWLDAVHADDQKSVLAAVEEKAGGALSDPGFPEYRVVRPDGSVRWVLARAYPVHDEGGQLIRIAGIAEDITERKRMEESLLSEKLLSENYINSLPGLFYVFDEQRFVRWNSEWGRVTGYSDEELACRYGPDFAEGEGKTLIEERMSEVFREGVSDAEADLVTKDGRRIPYHFTGLRREFNGKPHLVGLGIDITDRKKAEEERHHLEEQLRQSQKMEAVGQLAGGVAHDFNNVLTAILGNAELLLSLMADDSRKDSQEILTRGLEQIKSAGERAAAFTRRLLAFSAKRSAAREVFETREIVADTEKMLRQLIRENITLDVTVDPNTSRVCVGAGQIEQILMNLVLNACDALPKCGLIRVICGNITLSEPQVAGHPAAKPGPHVMIRVTDNGTGMDKETVGRVFEPFFTTKPVGRGIGLGLAVVYGAVTQAEGHITVESEVGKGTTFRVYLPAAGGEIAALAPPPPLRELRGDEVILVCEDEELVRQVTCRVLKDAGYTVLEASGGNEALKIAAGQKKPVDLLVTDVIMPGMNGRELADAIARRYPSVRIVLVSGYTADVAGDAVSKSKDAEFLQKPFSPTVLLERVRKVLDLERA